MEKCFSVNFYGDSMFVASLLGNALAFITLVLIVVWG